MILHLHLKLLSNVHFYETNNVTLQSALRTVLKIRNTNLFHHFKQYHSLENATKKKITKKFQFINKVKIKLSQSAE